VKKQDEDNSLNGILSKYTKTKDSASLGLSAGLGLLNLAQTSRHSLPPDTQLIQESELGLLTEEALDDAMAVAEVETGEPDKSN